MKLILPIMAIIATILATLTTLVFCMSMGANSTPAQLRALKLWMAGLTGLGVAGVVAGLYFIRAGQPNTGAAAAFAPTILFSILFVIALIK